jgi:hypothetical protein
MIVKIEEARPVHVYEILRNLRSLDQPKFARIEDPAKALIDMLHKSTRAFVGLIDGEVACLWGMHAKTLLADAVYLWMVTTAAAEAHPFVFVRHSQRMKEAILEEYGTIEGHVFVDNAVSAKWLKWLGAELEESSIEGTLEFKLRRAG